MKKIIVVGMFFLVLLMAFASCGESSVSELAKDLLQSKQGSKDQPPVNGTQTILNVQYIRTFPIYNDDNWGKTFTIVVSSKNELEQYYEKNKSIIWDGYGNEMPDNTFLNAIEKYSDTFFEDNFLIIVSLMEGSGSNRHKVEKIDNNNGDVVIKRLLPGFGTADIANWSIIIELNCNSKLKQYQAVLLDELVVY